jgi:hypothetical protein
MLMYDDVCIHVFSAQVPVGQSTGSSQAPLESAVSSTVQNTNQYWVTMLAKKTLDHSNMSASESIKEQQLSCDQCWL